jgi:hypothetical protein
LIKKGGFSKFLHFLVGPVEKVPWLKGEGGMNGRYILSPFFGKQHLWPEVDQISRWELGLRKSGDEEVDHYTICRLTNMMLGIKRV